MGSIKADIKAFLFPPSTTNDVVTNNAKLVLYGLFTLIGLAILFYAITAGVAYNSNPDNLFIPSEEQNLNKKIENRILNSNLTDEQKLVELQERSENFSEQLRDRYQERFQQLEQLNAVYIAAISGAIALGGTLISQLWGRRPQ
jgi:hypothetical protein